MRPTRPPGTLQCLRREELVSVGSICHWFQDVGFIFESNKAPVGKEITKYITPQDSFLVTAEIRFLTRERMKGEAP